MGDQRPKQAVISKAEYEALAEFRKGLEAEMKYYPEEAYEHYRAASDLDPDFAMARLKQIQFTKREGEGKEVVERMNAELRGADLSRLNRRERFLLEYRFARVDKENAKAEKLLTAYLERYPDDDTGSEDAPGGVRSEARSRRDDRPGRVGRDPA